MNKKLIGLSGLLGLALLLAGCSGIASSQAERQEEMLQHSPGGVAEAQPAEAIAESERAAPDPATNSQPNLVPQEIPPFDHALAEEEYGWRQLLPRDGIRPIYEDELQFVPAEDAPYSDEELVIGVEINGEARAYAIGPLNRREMVNDTVGGTPILVTW